MPIYDDLDDRGSHADFIERCRRDFETTGNPLYAWEAWGLVRLTWRSELHDSLDLPEWFAEYLDACGSRLLGRQPERVELSPNRWGHLPEREPPKLGEGAGAIGCALGFSEGLALARKHWGGQFDDRENRAARVVDLMWSERLSLDAAAEKLERTNGWPERRTIRRAVEGAMRGALRRMQDRLREATGVVPDRGEVVRAYSDLCRSRNLTKQPG